MFINYFVVASINAYLRQVFLCVHSGSRTLMQGCVGEALVS